MSSIETFTLRDVGPKGGLEQAEMVAGRIVDFVGRAERSLVLALYDIRLPDPVGSVVADAFRTAAERGVKIRLAYNDVPEDPDAGNFLPAVHPPPETNPEILGKLPLETKPISGIPDLMHHKYMVRDGKAVWTGSANWSIYSWTRQENVLAVIDHGEVAREYLENFEELWQGGKVERTGRGDPNPIRVGEATVRISVHPRPRRGTGPADFDQARCGPTTDQDRLAGPHLGADPRHPGRDRNTARPGHRRGGRRAPDRPGL